MSSHITTLHVTTKEKAENENLTFLVDNHTKCHQLTILFSIFFAVFFLLSLISRQSLLLFKVFRASIIQKLYQNSIMENIILLYFIIIIKKTFFFIHFNLNQALNII
jgi:hypothetical protein